jgi:hypothetical protein
MTRWGTIVRLLGWCCDSLQLFEGDNTPENFEKHWQYRGYPPVERIISGQIIQIQDINIIPQDVGEQQDSSILFLEP